MYGFVRGVPIDEGFYKRVIDGLGLEPPRGLLAHLAVKRPEGLVRHLPAGDHAPPGKGRAQRTRRALAQQSESRHRTGHYRAAY